MHIAGGEWGERTHTQRERVRERASSHMLLSALSLHGCPCLCVCVRLPACLCACLLVSVCMRVLVFLLGRQNETCAPHFVSVSCQTCWKKVRLTFCTLLVCLFRRCRLNSRRFNVVCCCRCSCCAAVVVALVVAGCGGVQLDYLKGQSRGLTCAHG